MHDLHTRICAFLYAKDESEFHAYMLDYAIFMQKQVEDTTSDRATTRDAYVASIARQYIDDLPEIATAVDLMESSSRKATTGGAQCDECSGYLLSGSGYDVCERCGHTVPRGDESIAAVPFGVTVDHTKYPYRRQHHFKEWLCQIQGRESTRIPDEDIERIKSQMRKERVLASTMDQKRLRSILKTLRMQKLYEHVPYLLHCLDGSPPPQLSYDLEQLFMKMFSSIQEPFERNVKVISPERKNFLSYAFVLAKFCQLSGRTDLMHCFSQLKSREKLLLQDRIWKCICIDLGWAYYPSA